MTDEEFGRAYAAQMGWKLLSQGGVQTWVDPPFFVRTYFSRTNRFKSPKLAYETIGRAVRTIHAAVPPLREEQS